MQHAVVPWSWQAFVLFHGWRQMHLLWALWADGSMMKSVRWRLFWYGFVLICKGKVKGILLHWIFLYPFIFRFLSFFESPSMLKKQTLDFWPKKNCRTKPRTFSSETGSSNFQLPDLGFLEVQRDLCRYGLGLAEATSHVEDRLLARAFPAQRWTRAESSYCGDLEVEKQLEEQRNGQTWDKKQ